LAQGGSYLLHRSAVTLVTGSMVMRSMSWTVTSTIAPPSGGSTWPMQPHVGLGGVWQVLSMHFVPANADPSEAQSASSVHWSPGVESSRLQPRGTSAAASAAGAAILRAVMGRG
jgi:hypothetical protein